MNRLTKNLLLTVVVLVLIVLALQGSLDAVGKHYTESSLKRALVTFGVARGLNAVISVVQGTEVAMEPAGVGVVFTPGQILDPVNDLVERFSWVMLVCSSSLGLQSLLLKIFSAQVFTVLLVMLLGAFLIMKWWKQPIPVHVRSIVYRLAILLVILRFIVPLMAMTGEGFYNLFLESDYQASSTYLSKTEKAIGSFDTSKPATTVGTDDSTWYQRLQGSVKGALDAVDVQKNVAALQQAVQDLSEHIINLVVVFVLQTILFPLLFLWLAVKLAKRIFIYPGLNLLSDSKG